MALPTSTNDVTARKLGSVINSLWTKIKSVFAKKENGIYWVNGTTSYPAWAANTAYAVGDNVYTTGDGNCWTCKTAHTSGSSWSSTNWNRISQVTITGTNSDIESLYSGLTIAYKVNVCGGEGSTLLNLNSFGAKRIYKGTGEFYRWTASKNAVVLLTYDGTYWRMSDYDSNDQYVVQDAYCSTAAGTAAKAATSMSFSYSRHNNIGFRIYFTNTNTSQGQLTLNVNGQGAKNLWINGANSSSSNYTINAGIYWCYYDGTQFQLWTDKSFQAAKYRGDGSNLTEAFTAASSRSNIATGESNTTIFGKIAKWFSDLGTAAFKNVPSSGNAGTSEVVLGSDTRLSDARTPTSHSHGNIANGGTLTDTAAAAAGNDYVVIRDADNAKIQTSTIKGTDVADAVSKKHSHSTLTLSTTAQAYDGSHTLALPSTDPYTSARTPTSHTHGNITNGGALQTTDITIANGDKLVVTDSSDSSKVARASISFDGSTTTKALTQKGTWETFNNYSHPAGSAASKTGVPTGNVSPAFGGTFKVNQISTDSTSHVSAITERTITIPNSTATTTDAGLMSAADKTKLDNAEVSETLSSVKVLYYTKSITSNMYDYQTIQMYTGYYNGSGYGLTIGIRHSNGTAENPLGTLNLTIERNTSYYLATYAYYKVADNKITFAIVFNVAAKFRITYPNNDMSSYISVSNTWDDTGWTAVPNPIHRYHTWKQSNDAIGGTNAPVYVNANGEVKACTTYANATVGSANKPTGFDSKRDASQMTWGTLSDESYTFVTDWHAAGGGDIAFAEKDQKLSIQIDGNFYQNEGNYRVLDTHDVTSTYSSTGTSPVNGTAVASAISSKSDTSHTHSVKINGTTKTIAATGGTAVDLGTYLTAHQTIKQDGVTGATVNRFGQCTTAAATAAKTVSITAGTFSLEQGAQVAVSFSNANTANSPSLNVAGTGAKNIFVNGEQVTSGTSKTLLKGTVLFVYDGVQFHLIGNYYNSTGFAQQFSLGWTTTNTTYYTMFATMAIANTSGNGEAQCILSSATGIGGTDMGTWLITISNRGSTADTPKATMTVRELNKQSQETPPEFGYYYDTANSFIYYGVKTPGYRGNSTLTILSNSAATMMDYGDVTTEPTGWTAVTITEYSTSDHNHDSVYLKLSGGTMTGMINAWSGKYADDGMTGAINMNNSNIVGLNSIYTADLADNAAEGIHFYRSNTNNTVYYDSLWVAGGSILFAPNRAVGTSTTAANSEKVARLPTSITTNQVVLTDGTSGKLKTSAATSLTVGKANNLNFTHSNEINFTNVPTTGNKDRVWFNYRNGDTDATDADNKVTGYFFGNRNGVTTGVTLYADNFTGTSTYATNTKVTTATTTKTYLAGATATGYTSGAQTSLLADTGVYLTTTAGELNATQFKVNEHCTMKYNSTKSSLDFVFS